jgi:hypothetical protein
MTWQPGTIEEAGDGINWIRCWVETLTWVCECLRSGDDVAGAPDRIQVGDHVISIPCSADDVVGSPYRQGSKGVGCAGSCEHGPHLLREGHMGEGGGGRRLVC